MELSDEFYWWLMAYCAIVVFNCSYFIYRIDKKNKKKKKADKISIKDFPIIASILLPGFNAALALVIIVTIVLLPTFKKVITDDI